MQPTVHPRDVRWWFWAATLAFLVATLAGWPWGHGFVIAISFAQVLFFWAEERSPLGFATQVRWVYFALTLLGLAPALRLPVYALLLVGTVMVTFFDRCAIALVLKKMPWNEGRRMGAG